MKRMRALFLFCSVLLFNISIGKSQGYKINVEVAGIKDTNVILGYYSQSKMFVSDTIRVDKSGKGVFADEKPLPQGVYLVYMPNQTYFDFLVGSDQVFSLKTTSPDYVKNLVVSGAVESERFLEYQRFLINKQEGAKALQEKIEKLKDQPDSVKIIQSQLQSLGDEVKVMGDRLIEIGRAHG